MVLRQVTFDLHVLTTSGIFWTGKSQNLFHMLCTYNASNLCGLSYVLLTATFEQNNCHIPG